MTPFATKRAARSASGTRRKGSRKTNTGRKTARTNGRKAGQGSVKRPTDAGTKRRSTARRSPALPAWAERLQHHWCSVSGEGKDLASSYFAAAETCVGDPGIILNNLYNAFHCLCASATALTETLLQLGATYDADSLRGAASMIRQQIEAFETKNRGKR